MKRWLCACGVAVVALLVLGAAEEQKPGQPKPEFVIDSYEFTWHVAQAGDVKLDLAKTEDALVVSLSDPDSMDFLSLDGPSAEAVGTALARTDEFYQKMGNSATELSETVKTEKWQVTFLSQPEHGFWISVRPNERFSFTSLRLERKDALALAPHLQKAGRMLRFLDERIRP